VVLVDDLLNLLEPISGELDAKVLTPNRGRHEQLELLPSKPHWVGGAVGERLTRCGQHTTSAEDHYKQHDHCGICLAPWPTPSVGRRRPTLCCFDRLVGGHSSGV
jgi:hypothetical protein